MISELPLFLFTTLAGLAAGAYIASAVFPLGKDAKRPWLFPLVCLLLLGLGLLALPSHLEHPERMLAAFSQPGAMIAQEAYWSIAFAIVVLVDLIVSKVKGTLPRALRIVGAVAAAGLVVVMANAYFVSAGIPAWCSWQVFPLYIFGDLAMGAALLPLFEKTLMEKGSFVTTAGVLSLLAAVSMALEAVHFSSVDESMILLVIGAIVALVGAVLQFAAKAGKLSGENTKVYVFVCLFIGVAIARYGFYAACAI